MKYLTLSLALFISISGFSQYHIKVVRWGADLTDRPCYTIHFTNDNWKTFENIIIANEATKYYKASYQEILFEFQEGDVCKIAVNFAKQFKTYQHAKAWNDAQMKLYLKYRTEAVKKHLPPPACPDTQIY
jgi:hypothetical protein